MAGGTTMGTSGTEDTLLPASPAESPAVAHVRPESRLGRGDRVDRYDVVDYVGAGGMGVVYRARDRMLGREVAIKMLRGPAPGTDSCGLMCSLLMREAQTMARLSHPNLITVHDVGEFRGCVYLAMEFIDGVTLRVWAREPSRGWRQRLDVLLAGGRGLAAAHAAQVVHRDFKPDNVLISGQGRVVVTDFGLARRSGDLDEPAVSCGCAPGSPVTLDPDAQVGTPPYMSPEQHDGAPVDARSDQFGFAASAWEVLSGSAPFVGGSLAELRAAKQAQALVTPPESALPAAVATVLRRALRESASTRYVSMTDLLDRLAAAAG